MSRKFESYTPEQAQRQLTVSLWATRHNAAEFMLMRPRPMLHHTSIGPRLCWEFKHRARRDYLLLDAKTGGTHY